MGWLSEFSKVIEFSFELATRPFHSSKMTRAHCKFHSFFLIESLRIGS